MARYFKYKSAADLVTDARELGSQLDVAENLDSLYTSVSIDDRVVGNRLCIQPMEGCDGTLDGLPDELTYRRYQRFGAGGAKLIWGEATAVSDAGRMNPRQLWIHEGSASALEKMLAGCRQSHRETCGTDSDLLIGLQLTHSGRYSCRKPLVATHDPILDPLTVDKSNGNRLDSHYPLLTDSELQRIEDQFVAAAKLAADIGCDFVDLKQCHRYLLSELLASRNRAGDYGGSFENRTRFIRNIAGRIRDEVPGLILASRFNGYDGIPYRGEGQGVNFVGVPCPHELPLQTSFGVNPQDHRQEDLTEPIALARLLRDCGLRILNVTMGNPYANPHIVRPAEFPPVDGYHCPEHPLIGVCRHLRIAAAIQNAVPDIPVAGSGYSWLQDYALHVGAAAVTNGQIGFVGLGRAALSHPDFGRVARETGKLNRKQVCRTFSYCTGLMRNKNHPLGQFPTGCPPFDKEVYGPIWKQANGDHPVTESSE